MITNIIPYDPAKYYYSAIDLPLAKVAWTPVETSSKLFLCAYRITFIAPIIIMTTCDFIIGNMLRMTFGNFFLFCENNLTKKVEVKKSWIQKHWLDCVSLSIIAISIASVYITVKHPSIFNNLLKRKKISITKPSVVISKAKNPWIKQKILVLGIMLASAKIYTTIIQIMPEENKKKTTRVTTDQVKSLLTNPWWHGLCMRGEKMKKEKKLLANQQ